MPVFKPMLFTSLLRSARRTTRLSRSLSRMFMPPVPPKKPVRRPAAASAAASPPLPEAGARGDVFRAGSFVYRRAEQGFRIYLPPTGKAPTGLLVMLHGCKQNPEDFAAGTAMNELAREAGLVVLYPAQSGRANAQRCWRWFEAAHQKRGVGEPGWIAALSRAVQRHYRVPPKQVFIAGLSAGGAMAAITAQQYPEIYAACGVHSGLAPGSARGVLDALSVMRRGSAPWTGLSPQSAPVPTIVFHGDQDKTVHPRHADNVLASALGPRPEASAAETQHGKPQRGHGYSRQLYRDPAGRVVAEQWQVAGMGHAWSGGRPAGSYTDPAGPDASAAMLDFFLSVTGK